MNNVMEAAFADELEKIAGIKDIARSVKSKAEAVLERMRKRLGSKVMAAGSKIKGPGAVESKAKRIWEAIADKRNIKPAAIGAGGILSGAALAKIMSRGE